MKYQNLRSQNGITITAISINLWGFAFFPNIVMNLIKNGRLKKDDEHAREVWERHGRHDTYMTMDEIRSLARKHIPTAKIQRKLFWRYLLVWEK